MVTIKDLFDVIQAGTVSRAVIPIENSTNGSVVFSLDLFADRNNSYPDISVCGEIYHDVHHCLLGHKSESAASEATPSTSAAANIDESWKPKSEPLSSLAHIEKIYSHPQAWGQCEIFLQAYLKGKERIDVSSTSKAAELVGADTSGKSCAISSRAAAEVHNLDILGLNIEDKSDNTTRFFVVRKGLEEDEIDKTGPFSKASPHEKSLVSFTVDHKSPGALADVLAVFGKYGLNLTSINSRPSRVHPFQYIFFVEFEGSKLNDPEGRVKSAFEDITETAHSWRWLGSWRDELSTGKR